MMSGDVVPLAANQVVPPSSEYWYDEIGSPPGPPAVNDSAR